MAYPESVDMFVEKLNKADAVYVIEDEELVLENGVFEGALAHDNVKNESVMVFTEPKMSGERIRNFFLSVPSNAPWKRIIKVFANAPRVYVTYETAGDQVEAEDINRVQESIVNTQKEVERYKAANDQAVNDLGTRLSTVESKKADKTYVDTELLKKADKENTYTKDETDSRIQAIIGAAPEALDTLAEIAEALNNDPDFAATITNMLAQKVDKVAGMGLSEANFTNEEKTKLSGIEEGANKYIHPSTHPASMIVETSEKRFVSDIEKATWNAKETPAGAQEKADIAEQNAKAYADSIKPTKVSELENDENFVTQEELENAGYGDMMKSVYDINGDGIVDNADKLDGYHASSFVLKTGDTMTGVLSVGDIKIRKLGSETDTSSIWWKLVRIQNRNPINSTEYTSFAGFLVTQRDYGNTISEQANYTFSFGVRGRDWSITPTPVPVLISFGNATPTGASKPRFQVWKDVNGWHYLYFEQPRYSKFCTFLYAFSGDQEYWIQEDPNSVSGLTKVWDSATDSVQDMYVGINKVWHAGNFDPNTKLNKGPLTWNQLKGVM